MHGETKKRVKIEREKEEKRKKEHSDKSRFVFGSRMRHNRRSVGWATRASQYVCAYCICANVHVYEFKGKKEEDDARSRCPEVGRYRYV